ncbi:threonine ammonia-lyase [Sphingomonas sp. ASY06-1R]|uniref:threonine ammonia-lyase n=1 Tax=Sphingomonas sp. ASY06-1R TaxID=3445771 RepID=UPI003FA284C1
MNFQSHNEGRVASRGGILAAADRIAAIVTRTPLLPVPATGGRVWIKAESLQLGGAFKLRGAYNRLAQIAPEQRAAGVVAFSSGNHAQGVARAAGLLGMPAVIVMPADAPTVKLDATKALGAQIVLYDRRSESRERIAAALAAERGAVLVPSFDDVDVIEGQGTVGLEIADQLGRAPAQIIVPCGGGGLSAGIALAVPDTQVVVAEPEGWDDMTRSLAAGEILEVAADAPATSCDALQTMRVADRTFTALATAGAHGAAASEAQIHAAMRYAFGLGLVVEPGGAAALAVWLAGTVPAKEGDTVIVCSGSNVDPQAYARIIG